jgi:hypothetical protein
VAEGAVAQVVEADEFRDHGLAVARVGERHGGVALVDAVADALLGAVGAQLARGARARLARSRGGRRLPGPVRGRRRL